MSDLEKARKEYLKKLVEKWDEEVMKLNEETSKTWNDVIKKFNSEESHKYHVFIAECLEEELIKNYEN